MTDPPRPDKTPAAVIALPQKLAPPPVVAVISGKGGVGRTHLAVNLACLWRAAGHRMLLIDGDIALGGADLLLGVAPTHTVADVIEGRATVAEAVAAGAGGVDLLAATAGRSDLAVLGADRRDRLLSAVDALESRYDSVVLDTGPGLSPDAVGLCAAASEVVAVATPEPASVEGVTAWLSVLATGTSVRRVTVVANLVSSEAAGRDVFRRVVQRADHRPGCSALSLDYLGAIPFDPVVGRAGLRGEPFCLAAPDAAAASALRRAAAQLCQRASEVQTPPRSGLFWRHGGRPSAAARPRGSAHY